MAGLLLCLAGAATAATAPVYFNKGTLSSVSGLWQTVVLDHDYTNMVVVCTPNYDKSSRPAVVRVREVTPNSFQVRVQNPGNQGAVTADVHYVVLEAGVYTRELHGMKLEAARFLSTRTDSKASWTGQRISYRNAYVNPVVLGQVMTQNDARWSVFWSFDGTTRDLPPSRTGIGIGKQVGKDREVARTNEVLGYMVFEAGLGELDGVTVQATLGPDRIAGVGVKPPYLYYPAFPEEPGGAVATMSGVQSQSGGWALLYGAGAVSSNALKLAIDEDQIGSPERSHGTENVSYLLFSREIPVRPPTVAFEVASGEGPESVTSVSIPVFLSAPQPSIVTVEYSVVGGSAQPGSDFVLNPGVLTFLPGEVRGFIPLRVVDELLEEPDETVILELRNPSGAVLGPSRHTYTVRNDDQFVLNVVSGGYVPEQSAVSISFIGEENTEYDLIFVDAPAFKNSLSNQWNLAARGETTTLLDPGGAGRLAPIELPANTIRFYRISAPGLWEADGPRYASKEVYAFCPVQLHPGQNWVGLWGVPDVNEAARVLGRTLPAGSTPNDSTRVSWYERTGGQLATREIWMARGSVNQWVYSVGGSGSADAAALPLEEGFILELPAGAPPTRLPMTLRVPETPVSQRIKGQGAYNLVSLRAPQQAHPRDLGLVEAGFRGSVFPILSDVLWGYDAKTQRVTEILWYNTMDRTWRFMSSGFPLVPPDYLKPYQSVVIHTRAGVADFNWTIPLLYTPPTETMTP